MRQNNLQRTLRVYKSYALHHREKELRECQTIPARAENMNKDRHSSCLLSHFVLCVLLSTFHSSFYLLKAPWKGGDINHIAAEEMEVHIAKQMTERRT